MKRIFMIDGHALVFRAYYAFINRPMINSKGVETSAVYGFCRSLFDIILKEKPTHLFVAFDPRGKNFRHDAFPDYKANRPEAPVQIAEAIPVIRKFLDSCHIPVIVQENAEADDVIGTLSKRAEKEGFQVFMVTPDKDFGQLVSENVVMYRPLSRGDGWEVVGVGEICDRFGISRPEQVVDVLAIWGDASDNIPGVRGIGEVGAKRLISRYGSVDNVLLHMEELPASMQKKLAASKEVLALSKDLVTIRTQLDIPWDEASLRIEAPDLEQLKELMREYEFHSLIRRLPKLEEIFCCTNGMPKPATAQKQPLQPAEEAPREAPKEYTPLDSPGALERLMHQARQQGMVSLAGTSAFLVFYTAEEAYGGTAAQAAALLTANEPDKCGFGLKELMRSFDRQGIPHGGMVWDPGLMHYLINPERSHRPADLAIQYLNYFPEEQVVENRDLFSTTEEDNTQNNNLLTEAFIAWHLKEPLRLALEKDGMEQLYLHMEMPLMEVLAAVESEGVKIDTRQMKAYGEELQAEANAIEKQVRDYAEEPNLNVSSPKQLGVVLYDKLKIDDRSRKGKKKYSTDEETLSALADRHPIVPLILEFRSLKKLLSTYIDALPTLIDPVTGRIHTTFNQTVTATGRLSSQDPNLQNIPIREERGREIRRFFIPRDNNHLLLSADYSQIELRIMAHMSQDPDLIAAFRAGEDIHTATAAKIFRCRPEEVTPGQRNQAKTANFGIIYGISAYGLATRLKIPRTQAADLINGYFEHYPKVKDYLDTTIARAREDGYVQTLFKRRRYAPDIRATNPMLRGLAERNAINAPIQGTAADIIKKAMVEIQKSLGEKKLASKMILQVHDELLFDVFLPEKEEMEHLVRSIMEHVTQLDVPLLVGMGWGKNWMEAH
ncbi:MAG: DNA polymerase I [Bacteroidales bacterium]|nr:DNA polymerase I [Bacteroidales bacterium]NLK79203.1 DNA polymerase I [Bacteroidales bacterium]